MNPRIATVAVLVTLPVVAVATRAAAQESPAELGAPPSAQGDVAVRVTAGPDQGPTAPRDRPPAEVPAAPGSTPAVPAVPPPPPAYYAAQPSTAYSAVPSQPVAQARDGELPPGFVQRPGEVDEESPSRAGRVAAEAGAGLAGLFLGGLGGLYLGCAGGGSSCTDTGMYLAATGALVGLPTGVWLAGSALDGNGGWGWTLLGSLAGWVCAGGVLAAGAGSDSAIPAVIASLFPVGGGILGYELSSDPSADAAERRASRFAAALSPVPGGATLSFAGAL